MHLKLYELPAVSKLKENELTELMDGQDAKETPEIWARCLYVKHVINISMVYKDSQEALD